VSETETEDSESTRGDDVPTAAGTGLVFGLVFGTTIGAMFGHVVMGTALGPVAGMLIGAADRLKEKERQVILLRVRLRRSRTPPHLRHGSN